MNVLQMQRFNSSATASCSRQTSSSSTIRAPTLQRHVCHSALLCKPSQGSRRGRLQIVAGERQSSNVTTKRRLTGGTGLPPIDGGDDGGGGGGGDGWGWEKTARNVLPNLVFLGMYFAITSWGGDGWGNGNFFGGGGGGGGGGGDGNFGSGASQPNGSGSNLHENQDNDHAADEESSEDATSEEAAPVYSYGYQSRREYR